MTMIRYTGKSPRMVHGRFMYTDDVRDVNPRLAKSLENDPDFVVAAAKSDTPAEAIQPAVVEKVPAPVPVGNVVLMPEAVNTTVTPEPVEKVVKVRAKSRRKK